MSNTIVNVSDSTFDEEVLRSSKPVLVDFWAAWCGPCKLIAPTLEQVAMERGQGIKICKLNIDDNPDTPTKYQIQSIPTLLLFKGGELVGQRVGNLPKEEISRLIDGVQ